MAEENIRCSEILAVAMLFEFHLNIWMSSRMRTDRIARVCVCARACSSMHISIAAANLHIYNINSTSLFTFRYVFLKIFYLFNLNFVIPSCVDSTKQMSVNKSAEQAASMENCSKKKTYPFLRFQTLTIRLFKQFIVEKVREKFKNKMSQLVTTIWTV